MIYEMSDEFGWWLNQFRTDGEQFAQQIRDLGGKVPEQVYFNEQTKFLFPRKSEEDQVAELERLWRLEE